MVNIRDGVMNMENKGQTCKTKGQLLVLAGLLINKNTSRCWGTYKT